MSENQWFYTVLYGFLRFLTVSYVFLHLLFSYGKHYVTQLIIKHYHEKSFHENHETVISELRKNDWIIGLRRALRSLINKLAFVE